MSNQKNISDHLKKQKKDVWQNTRFDENYLEKGWFPILGILAITNFSIPLAICDDN